MWKWFNRRQGGELLPKGGDGDLRGVTVALQAATALKRPVGRACAAEASSLLPDAGEPIGRRAHCSALSGSRRPLQYVTMENT